MTGTIVDQLYNEFRSLASYLDQVDEPSLRIAADGNFRKSLLLAAASHFEHQIRLDILNFVKESSDDNQLVVELVKNKATESRQYHTYFNWESQNANQFFALFGDSFKETMGKEVANSEELNEAIKAFLEIGEQRNRLVHQDFGNFTLEKTTEEIYMLYQTALRFVEAIPDKLRQFSPQPEDT